jgi:hypothetical protein
MNNVEKIARAILADRHYGVDPDSPIASGEAYRLDPTHYIVPRTNFTPAWGMYGYTAYAIAKALGLDTDNEPIEVDNWVLIRKSELERTGRDCIGIELSPAYFDIAAKRLGLDQPAAATK